MILLLIFFGAIVCILLISHIKLTFSNLYSCIEKSFPGPKRLPMIGNSLEFIKLNSGGTKDFEIYDSYIQFQKICSKFPRFTRIWIGNSCYIVLYEAKDVEVILSSTVHIKKSNVYQYLYDWIGTGLLTSYGVKWRTHRKIITPAFHFKILEDFLQVFNNNGSILIELLSKKAGKGTFNIYSFINLYTLDNICETALGVNINAQKDSESEYVTAVKDIRNVISLRMFKIWLGSDFILNLTKYGSIYKKALNVLHKTTEDVIKIRKKKLINLKKPSKLDAASEYINQKERLAFLDLLILSETLTDLELREEVDTFMFEGHDTVTSGISFALYALAHNQEVQEKAFKEQKEIFGDSDRNPDWHDLQNMKYLDMVLKESQRLYPSIPLIGRTINEDLQLSDGYILPKGSYCTVNTAKLHRDPKVWPNPDTFNPDNFLPDATRLRNPYSFIPFSAGPRNCIGQRFAVLEMRSCISKIIRNFKINPSKDHNNNAQISGELILFSTNGINVELENRKSL